MVNNLVLNISIVVYNTPFKELVKLVNSCIAVKNIGAVYIIDNSLNNELNVIQKCSSVVKYFHNPSNPGFGSAHNIAMRNSIENNIQYHLIVNPDICFSPDVVESLVSYLDENNDVGVIMPQILYPSGEIQHLCKLMPTPMDLIGRRFIPINKMKSQWKYEMRWTGYDKIMEAPNLSGCFTCFRVSVLDKVGVFDERYFMYLEDFDLFRRVGDVSKCIFYPKVSVTHDYGKGSYSNLNLLKHHIISAIKYFSKWGWFFDKKRSNVNRKFNNL